MQNAVRRKHSRGDILTSWIAPRSLYELWSVTSGVTSELFADCFNENGVLDTYCSEDLQDETFGSTRTWECNEANINAGAANPPFTPTLLENLLSRFEEGVQKSVRYCRCVIFLIGRQYNILRSLERLSFEGQLLVTIPAGCFPFKNQRTFLAGDYVRDKPNVNQTLGVFIWYNREHLISFPPPVDVEEAYQYWCTCYLEYSEGVTVHRYYFQRDFPSELRSSERVLSGFLNTVHDS